MVKQYSSMVKQYGSIRRNSSLGIVDTLVLVTRYADKRLPEVPITVENQRYFFLRDPLTLTYAYSAITKIKNIVSAIPNPGSPRIVFDVGANNGWFTSALAERFGRFQAYLFEPNSKLNPSMHKNLKDKSVTYEIINSAVSAQPGCQTFFVTDNNSQQSSLYRQSIALMSDTKRITESQVNVVTIDSFCKENNIQAIDILKIDVQGAEWSVLCGAKQMLRVTSAVIIEMSFLDPEVAACFQYLRQEFDEFHIISPVTYGADIVFFRGFNQGNRVGTDYSGDSATA